MKYCSKCGTQLNDDDIFCTKCGNKISLPNFQEKIINSTNNNEKLIEHVNQLEKDSNSLLIKLKSNKMTKYIKAYMCPLIIGIVLIMVGLFIQVPGGALTTLESLDGDTTEFSAFDDKYSSIDEYVGGDAYNYIIGASLVAGKISGTMTTKAILVVGGALCLCLGITLKLLPNKEVSN